MLPNSLSRPQILCLEFYSKLIEWLYQPNLYRNVYQTDIWQTAEVYIIPNVHLHFMSKTVSLKSPLTHLKRNKWPLGNYLKAGTQNCTFLVKMSDTWTTLYSLTMLTFYLFFTNIKAVWIKKNVKPSGRNAESVGVSQSLISHLQLVQDAAARLLTGTHTRQHIIPVLASLHWMSVSFRVYFKILMFVF